LISTCLNTGSGTISWTRANTLVPNAAKAVASASGNTTAVWVGSVLLSARPVDVTEQATINSKTEMQRIVVNTAFISLRNSIESADQTESTHHRCAMKA